MKVDVHWHHVPQGLVDAIVSGKCPIEGKIDFDGPEPAITVANGFRLRLTQRLCDPAEAIAAMDLAGLDIVAPSLAPPVRQYEADLSIAVAVSRLINDSFAEMAEASNGRLRPLANVPLQDPKAAIEELRRSVRELELSGVAIGTNVEGRNLGDPDFRPFWREVAELDTFVFLHPETVLGIDRLRRHEMENLVGFPIDTATAAASLIFEGVFEEFGPLKTCFAHGGGAFPYLISRWQHGYEKRLASRNPGLKDPYSYLNSMYCDSLTHGSRQLQFLIDLIGVDHVMLGCDYPFDMGDPQPVRTMEKSVTDEKARAMIGGDTAVRLLGIANV